MLVVGSMQWYLTRVSFVCACPFCARQEAAEAAEKERLRRERRRARMAAGKGGDDDSEGTKLEWGQYSNARARKKAAQEAAAEVRGVGYVLRASVSCGLGLVGSVPCASFATSSVVPPVSRSCGPGNRRCDKRRRRSGPKTRRLASASARQRSTLSGYVTKPPFVTCVVTGRSSPPHRPLPPPTPVIRCACGRPSWARCGGTAAPPATDRR